VPDNAACLFVCDDSFVIYGRLAHVSQESRLIGIAINIAVFVATVPENKRLEEDA